MSARSCAVCIGVVLLLLLSTFACSAERPVRVAVDGQPADMQMTDSSVLYDEGLVPARQTAEAFGAKVHWDARTRSLRIVGANAQASLKIGSRVAYINGSRYQFRYSPRIYGRDAYVPIIAFNRMFNAALIWDRGLRRFRWLRIAPPGRLFGAPPPVLYGPGSRDRDDYDDEDYRDTRPSATSVGPASGTVVGEVLRLQPTRGNARISVLAGGRRITYYVPSTAIVVRGRIGGAGYEIPLSSVRPGDQVTLRFDESGNVTSVRAQFRQINGRVRAIADSTIMLESGETVRVQPNTRIILPGNATGELQDVREGDDVVVGVSPASDRTYVVKVIRSTIPVAETAVQADEQLTLNSSGPFGVGDTVAVDFRGRPGGRAVLSIPGVRDGIPMTEIQPGLYRGQYTIQEGDILLHQPVKITFEAPGGQTYVRQSRQAISIRTIGGNLPQIASPRQGDFINSPLVVRGIAEPGARVLVTIEYSANVQGTLPIEGISAMEEVRADANGNWRTRPLAAVAPFGEDPFPHEFDAGIFSGAFRLDEDRPVIYTITASRLGPDGEPQASYIIEVIKSGTKSIERGLRPEPVEPNRRSYD